MTEAFEYLGNEGLSGFGAQLSNQQVYADDRQFFGSARAVRALPLGPFGLDVSH